MERAIELGTDSRGLFNLVCINKALEESSNKLDLARCVLCLKLVHTGGCSGFPSTT